jgi:hypothetical protein
MGGLKMKFKIGDRVKVIDQEITGTIVAYDCGNKVVVDDDELEENLVFHMSDLEYLTDEICSYCGTPYNIDEGHSCWEQRSGLNNEGV